MNEFYVPTDVETTGLHPWKGHLLLELAAYVIVPSYPYEVVAGPFEAVIQHDREKAFNQASPYVQDMHTATGLWDRLEDGEPIAQVDERFRAWLKESGVGFREGYILGNSARLDANFIDYYLPKSAEWLHYRIIDVTSLGTYSRLEFGVPVLEKVGAHQALQDIDETMAEISHITKELTCAD